MLKLILGIIPCLFIASEAFAKIKIHPTFTGLLSITPHTAINRTQYGTDYYSAVGGNVDFAFENGVTLSPGYQLGVDTLGGQVGSYSNPSLELGIALSKIVEERFKYSGLFANTGGYHSELFGIGTHIQPNDTIEVEVTPQFFYDSIETQQLEVDLDCDITLSHHWQLNSDASIGRTYVDHVEDLTSYSFGGGVTYSFLKLWKLFTSVEFAHGLNTDSPYSILNSTSTINTQSGSRPIDFGNTALDPNGNTINITIGTTLDF